jgi:hypothetical protein
MRPRTKIILAVVGVAMLWPFAQIGLIAAQAQYYAGGHPYCIEVSSDRMLHYRPAASWLELNGFSLHAPFINGGGSGSTGSLQLTFHALLPVDTGGVPQWRNWSYWDQHFDLLTPQQIEHAHVYRFECQPEIDFILKLPLLAKP